MTQTGKAARFKALHERACAEMCGRGSFIWAMDLATGAEVARLLACEYLRL